MTDSPTQDHAADALRTLRQWAQSATPDEIAALDPALAQLLPGAERPNAPQLSRIYPETFRPDAAYKAGMPDLQNEGPDQIRGARRPIQHVGISNFRLPISFRTRAGGTERLEASVTGTVSLDAGSKGINMSRIMRSFYTHATRDFSFEVMGAVLDDYQRDLDSLDARVMMRFAYPVEVNSLRSGLRGWQYYDIALEMRVRDGKRVKVIHLDYVYSSTCPCSLELAEHARRERGQLATPHSQRSVARLSIALDEQAGTLWFEDLIDMCRAAIPTETQVMVKREDEQAFAELNAANPIFVEDAARLFAEALTEDPRVGDFRVVASHQESLHSHDAVSVLTGGELFAQASLDPKLFASLYHVG